MTEITVSLHLVCHSLARKHALNTTANSTEKCVYLLLLGVKGETYSLQISVKLTKDVFLVPTLTTCGGFMTNFRFSPATISGFFSRMMLNTLLSSCQKRDSHQDEYLVVLKSSTSLLKNHLKQCSQ